MAVISTAVMSTGLGVSVIPNAEASCGSSTTCIYKNLWWDNQCPGTCLYSYVDKGGDFWYSTYHTWNNLYGYYYDSNSSKPVANNAESAQNSYVSYNLTIHYGMNQTGAYNWLEPATSGNFTSTIRDNEVSWNLN
ncbi:MAG: hypothetical protein JWN52_2764 [Actinomycetia bacterium]|nr:hypothetical protein [Actinomycetes bacterium]